MRLVRRHDLTPRVEMTPLIDVIFLLLTFFIYSLIVMVHAEILPVQLTGVSTGQQAEATEVAALTIDAQGTVYFNRVALAPEALAVKLAELAALEKPPTLFLAMEITPAAGSAAVVDRGPVLIGLIERVRQAGITDFSIVGEPSTAGP